MIKETEPRRLAVEQGMCPGCTVQASGFGVYIVHGPQGLRLVRLSASGEWTCCRDGELIDEPAKRVGPISLVDLEP